ncbi:hypothetical protein Tco_0698643 [Tanacetum coccineum]
MYTIEERVRLLAEFFERRKKQLAAERAEAIRNKPPTRTQARNTIITYLKHMAGEKQSEESAKRQKLEDAIEEQESAKSDEKAATEYEHEKEELRMWLTIILDEEETGDLKLMFEPNAEDEVWSNQQDWTLISWKLYDNCRVHSLLLDGTLTCFNMLVEKRYPLIKNMLQKMLNWKLEAEAESTMAFELLKFIKS